MLKNPRWQFVAVAGALLFLILATSDHNGWLFIFAATSLFYIIPLGLGVFLTTWPDSSLSRLRVSWQVAAILCTTIGFALLPAIAETATHVIPNAKIVFYGLMTVAFVGLVCGRSLFQIAREHRNETAVMAAAVLAICATVGWAQWWPFSSFPFTDLFAETHKIKGAIQFADTGYVNHGGTSYAPLKEVLSGGLLASVGLDVLQSHWALTFYTCLYSAIAVWGFVDLVVRPRWQRWISLPLLAASPFFVPTNGNLVMPSSLLLLGLLISSSSHLATTTPSARDWRLQVLAPLAVSALILLASHVFPLALLALAVLLPRAAIALQGKFANVVSAYAIPVLLAGAIFCLHRGALLANVVVVTLWLLYTIVIGLRGRFTPALSAAVWISMAALPMIAGLGGLLVAAAKLKVVDFNLDRLLITLYSPVTQVILGERINPHTDLALGFGASNALLELVRWIGPLTAIIVAIWAGIWLWQNPPSRIAQRAGSPSADADQTLMTIWAWLSGMLILLFELSGFPFAYRANYLLLAVLLIALRGFVLDDAAATDRAEVSRSWYAMAVSTTAGLLSLSVGAYGLLPFVKTASYGYQMLQQPEQITILMGAVGATLALILATAQRAKASAFIAVLVLCTIGDRAGIATRLMPHSYGAQEGRISAVSHYTSDDIALARWIRAKFPRSLLVSDPYTLAITKAFTGAPGLYPFSNLDTLNPATGAEMKSLIATAVTVGGRGSGRRQFCSRLLQSLALLNNEAFVQITRARTNLFVPTLDTIWLSHTEKPTSAIELVRGKEVRLPTGDETDWTFDVDNIGSGKEAPLRFLSLFDKDTANGWNILLLLNERTLRWIAAGPDERLGYFPHNVKLDDGLVAIVRANDFTILHNENHNTLVVEVDCLKGESAAVRASQKTNG